MRVVSRLLIALGLAAIAAQALALDVVPREKPAPPPDFLRGAVGEAYRTAFEHAAEGLPAKALAALPPEADALDRDLVRWTALTAINSAGFSEITAFIESHPDWPWQATLKRRAEEAIASDTPDDALLAWFADHPPVTGRGQLAYGQALLDAGRAAEGIDWLRRGWRRAHLSSWTEKQLLDRHGRHLTEGDHKARADWLLWQRARQEAHRLLPHLPADYDRLVEARSALMAFAWNVDAAVAAVPDHLQSDAGLVYDRAYWRRIKGKHEAARELLLDTRVDGTRILRPDRWWRERHYQARQALRLGEIETAYRLAAEHAMLDGIDTEEDLEDAAGLPRRTRAQIADAEWLAGWIALRFLGRPADALKHFETMYSLVGLPVSLARGAYWSARAAEDLNDPVAALDWYRLAARHPTTFYGQLAMERAGTDLKTAAATAPQPDAAARAAFAERPLVQAAQRLAALGRDRELAAFVRHLTLTAKSDVEKALAAELGIGLDRPQVAVAAAKLAAYDGALIVEGYPVIELATAPAAPVSLIHAIARQESQFDPGAISHVGAMGLMQLMPATASRVARQLAYPYSKERLLTDPAYNLTLGSAHFSGLLQRYRGSPILALAAYNAGSGPVNRWLREYGDPRDFAADAVDWVETIPYGETRNYVQRVLEAAPVYSLRLGDGQPESLSGLLDLGRTPPPDDLLPRRRPALPVN